MEIIWRSVHRAARWGRGAMTARVRSLIWTDPCGLMNPSRRPPHRTLDRQEETRDLAVKGGPLGEFRLTKGTGLLFENRENARCVLIRPDHFSDAIPQL